MHNNNRFRLLFMIDIKFLIGSSMCSVKVLFVLQRSAADLTVDCFTRGIVEITFLGCKSG